MFDETGAPDQEVLAHDRLYKVCQEIAKLPFVQTSVGVILSTKEIEPRYVVVYNADRQRYGNPAGHLEPGEKLLEGVRREIQEETGLDGAYYEITGIFLATLCSHPQNPRLDIVFDGVVSAKALIKPDEQDEDVSWAGLLTADEIRANNKDYTTHVGGTVLRLATEDSGKHIPETILHNIRSCFIECGIPPSVLNDN